jgi:hypothetical protein
MGEGRGGGGGFLCIVHDVFIVCLSRSRWFGPFVQTI